MESQNKCILARTTKEQIECYLSFMQAHPEIKLHKKDSTCPKRIEELWLELAEELNALKGPTRTPTKWKNNLAHWRNQIRSRARKAKVHRLVTGGCSRLRIDLSPTEQRALNTSVVDGIAGVPTIGTEDEAVINNCSKSPLVVNTDVFNDTSLTSLSSPLTVNANVSRDTPSTSRSRKDEMFSKIITMIANSQQEEKQFRVESLQCINNFAESLNNVATAILSLSQSIQQNINKK